MSSYRVIYARLISDFYGWVFIFIFFLFPRLGSSVPAIKMFPHINLYLEVISSDFKKCSVMMASCKHSY